MVGGAQIGVRKAVTVLDQIRAFYVVHYFRTPDDDVDFAAAGPYTLREDAGAEAAKPLSYFADALVFTAVSMEDAESQFLGGYCFPDITAKHGWRWKGGG